ncbi:MAG: DUF305 domain-containing protein [Pseudolysinimonas sp.]|uniref:DUF305 domain-containing protein n=1 Tax=Pseudolysinimonas sp. TaxID=2680009 RepID=UPI003C743AC5
MKFRTAAIASTALAIALVLAGCSMAGMDGMEGMEGMEGGSSASPSSAPIDTTFNAADETFASGMIPHHEQAVEMASMVLDKEGVDPRVVALAERIVAAQQPEIDLLTSWLEAWGVGSDIGGMEGMDHSGGAMMSEDDMAALEAATGSEASKLFLEQMVQHHTGAIAMAQQELDNGENPAALELAQTIIDDQTAEIAEIQELLAQL